MTQLLNTLANTDAVIAALAAKYGFDPKEARTTVAAAFARSLQAELPMDATQAVAETSGLAADTKSKRVPAAFDLWATKDKRTELRASLPDGTKSREVTQAMRKAWADLSDDEKAPFVAESKRLRAEAKPPADPNAKRTRRRKDPNAPRGPKNAFMRYADTVRPGLIEAARAGLEGNAKINMADIGRKMGVMWGELPAEQKTPFEQAFEEDKARYAEEKAAYDTAKAQDEAEDEAAAATAEDDGVTIYE